MSHGDSIEKRLVVGAESLEMSAISLGQFPKVGGTRCRVGEGIGWDPAPGCGGGRGHQKPDHQAEDQKRSHASDPEAYSTVAENAQSTHLPPSSGAQVPRSMSVIGRHSWMRS